MKEGITGVRSVGRRTRGNSPARASRSDDERKKTERAGKKEKKRSGEGIPPLEYSKSHLTSERNSDATSARLRR